MAFIFHDMDLVGRHRALVAGAPHSSEELINEETRVNSTIFDDELSMADLFRHAQNSQPNSALEVSTATTNTAPSYAMVRRLWDLTASSFLHGKDAAAITTGTDTIVPMDIGAVKGAVVSATGLVTVVQRRQRRTQLLRTSGPHRDGKYNKMQEPL